MANPFNTKSPELYQRGYRDVKNPFTIPVYRKRFLKYVIKMIIQLETPLPGIYFIDKRIRFIQRHGTVNDVQHTIHGMFKDTAILSVIGNGVICTLRISSDRVFC